MLRSNAIDDKSFIVNVLLMLRCPHILLLRQHSLVSSLCRRYPVAIHLILSYLVAVVEFPKFYIIFTLLPSSSCRAAAEEESGN